MLDLLALMTNKRYWKFHSFIVKLIFGAYGVKVGKNFYIEGTPKLKIRGKAENIVIGNDVCIYGAIDLRNRENGKIIICDGAAIDNDCRFVAANDAVLTIGERTGIGSFSIFNCGVSVTIGKDCLFAGNIFVQSSEHGTAKGVLIREQKHTYGEISIGDDCWIAANAMIAKNSHIGDGCIVGAKSFVRNASFEPNTIVAGTPAKKIGERV